MAYVLYFEDDPIWVDQFLPILKAKHDVALHTESIETLQSINNMQSRDAPDIAVLDILEKRKDNSTEGFKICDAIKLKWPHVPVIFLTSLSSGSPQELMGLLDHKANYFISKPNDNLGAFLLAAIEMALSITDIYLGQSDTYTVGDLRISQSSRAVSWKSVPIILTPTEFSILDALASKSGAVLSYETLRKMSQINHVHDEDIDFIDSYSREEQRSKRLRNTLSAHIKSIRKKLEKADKIYDETSKLSFSDVIRNNRGFGYAYNKTQSIKQKKS